MKLIECPRDAMQGMGRFIPSQDKIDYIQQLLQVGFDTIDAGSFVSPKAIPQMSDTSEVLDALDLTKTNSKLLVIVANERGAKEAVTHPVDLLGFPLSLSETFQQRNTNKSIAEAFVVVDQIQEICAKSGKSLVVYLSMGFGNPYGDVYQEDDVLNFGMKLKEMGVTIVSLADTIGTANTESIEGLGKLLKQELHGVEIGMHLHTRAEEAKEKVASILRSGVDRLDGAIFGFGGCPMANDDLVGNMPTEAILKELSDEDLIQINLQAFKESQRIARNIFF